VTKRVRRRACEPRSDLNAISRQTAARRERCPERDSGFASRRFLRTLLPA
jgi:hypothetical protein